MYDALFEQQRDFFRSRQTQSLTFRLQALQGLKDNIKMHELDILGALEKDLGKSSFEAYATEVGYVLHSLTHMLKNIRSFAKDKRVPSPIYQWGMRSYVQKEPKGVVLIIGPFNYPFQLCIEPIIGAIAAGNTVILKPSELTPHTEHILMKIIGETFAKEHVSVVCGEKETTTALLQLPFDHIYFTGSNTVGKIVLKAAAEHLTPVTLELGGKSPAIVCKDADLRQAARRIAWGKFLNAGQTCVAPDYVLVQKDVQDLLIEQIKEAIRDFYGDQPQQSPDYGRIVNERHTKRLAAYLDRGQGTIEMGGSYHIQERYIAPTLVSQVQKNHDLMKEEIFGPILPVLTFGDLDVEIQALQKEPSPLALYVFTQDIKKAQGVTKSLAFGNGAINDTVSQVASLRLPFGGIGHSGMGAYHGKYSFDTFSHKKAMVIKGKNPLQKIIEPPYKNRLKLVRWILK